MMKLKKLAFILAACVAGSAASAQAIDLSPLSSDLTTLFTGVGQDLLPQVADLAMSGRPAVGAAEIKGLYLAIPSISVSTGSGIATVLNDSSAWKFGLLPLPSLVSNATKNNSSAKLVYDLVTAKSSPLPALRLGLGFPLGHGLELLADGLVIPNALVSSALDLAETDKSGPIHSLGVSFDLYSASATLRYVLLPEAKRSIRPAVSLGLEYSYLYFGLKMSGFSLDTLVKAKLLTESALTIKDVGTLGMSGNMDFTTSAQTCGLVLACSKTLGILRPFANVAFRYCNVSYGSSFNLGATLNGASAGELKVPAISLSESGVKMVAAGGFEFVLPLLILSTSLDLDFSTLKLNLADLSSSDFRLAGVAANLTLRLQF
jgi:hypothetical protein